MRKAATAGPKTETRASRRTGGASSSPGNEQLEDCRTLADHNIQGESTPNLVLAYGAESPAGTAKAATSS